MTQHPAVFKRLIVCCDGSWMDSLGEKGGEPQSNVSRLARVVRRTCNDGTHQIIMYDAGVGSGPLKLDQYTGGGFGMGLAENVREAYNFLCSNYVDKDDIVLVGFSRGAFTARSVADMVATIGLLTPAGLDFFYRIFEDYMNMASISRRTDAFLCPKGTIEPYGGETGEAKAKWADVRRAAYKAWLKQKNFTRDTYVDGTTDIKIKALAVWDTVGTLGIPPVSWLGLHGSADTWKFSNTQVSNRVENAFQALGLDEPRDAFKPALWERLDGNKTNLKQVWFPGNHGGVGGGWHDQQIANITLAWMCDQLSTVGVEFNFERMRETLLDGIRYGATHPFPFVPNWADKIKLPSAVSSWWAGPPLPWSTNPVFRGPDPAGKRDVEDCSPDCCAAKHPKSTDDPRWALARPWALGQTRYPSRIQTLIGSSNRQPGLYMRVDPDTNAPTAQPLLNTAERVHSSVRVRLACKGLAMDDTEAWRCEPLFGGERERKKKRPLWRVERGSGLDAAELAALGRHRPRELDLPDYPGVESLYPLGEADGRFRWVFAGESNVEAAGSARQVPQVKTLPEEPLAGYWERYLLAMTAGEDERDVWRYAEEHLPSAPF